MSSSHQYGEQQYGEYGSIKYGEQQRAACTYGSIKWPLTSNYAYHAATNKTTNQQTILSAASLIHFNHRLVLRRYKLHAVFYCF